MAIKNDNGHINAVNKMRPVRNRTGYGIAECANKSI